MQLHFLGAAGTVTGSRTLVTSGDARILVDCGLFQGLRELRRRNWRPPTVDPAALDAVLLTHAHIDHSGFVPRLIAQGFSGPVLCTEGTAALLKLLWPDAGHLQEEDARYANRKGFSKHRPAEPLFTEAQAEKALSRIRIVDWDAPVEVGPLTATWTTAGHILGASSIRLRDEAGSVLFSGDLGRPTDPLMPPPAPVEEAPDWVVLESTYGDRRHEDVDVVDQLHGVVSPTLDRGGVVLIPSFAVGRAQAVLYGLYRLQETGRLPRDVPIYMNSPMSVHATEIFARHPELHRLDAATTRAMCERVRFVRTVDESKQLNQRQGPMVVISASGMLTGGRVLHHLVAFADDPRNTLLFVGYQAAGTRGGAILGGDRQVKVHGRYIDIACEVARIDAWSAHADQRELVDWVAGFPSPPRHIFLNHGEPAAQDALALRLRDRIGCPVSIPAMGDTATLTPGPRAEARRPARAPWVEGPPEALREHLEALPARGWVQVLGGGAIPAPGAAARRVAEAELAVAAHPDDLALQDVAAVARRLEAHARWVEEAQRLAHRIADAPLPDHDDVGVVADGQGALSAAALRGAREVGLPTLALGLPEQPAPTSPGPDLSLRCSGPDARRDLLADRLLACIAFPGGFGTLADVLGHIAARRGPRPPLVLVGRAFWHEILDGERLRLEGLVPAHVLTGVHFADSAEQAWGLVRQAWTLPEAR